MIGTLSLTNCTKDETDNGFGSVDATENLITRTVTVSDEAWDEVRSSYEPGVGIHLDGTEHMSVYYSVSGSTSTAGSKTLGYKLLGAVDGAPAGNGSYTFSHPEVSGAEAYDYFFMMPYLVTSKQNSAGSASYHRIGPVQMPEAATFDPSFDYIVGKPVLNVAAADQSAIVTQFKRLMAPLRLKFTDNAGVLAGQKIRQVTISFDAATDKAVNKCMSGLFYFQYSEAADECNISGWENGSFSNAATADYPAGLEQNGSWETWLMVNPTEIEACNMTIDVVADKMRITRTVATGKVFNLTKEAINTLSFDISGDGYAMENAYSVDFTQYTKVPTVIEASDGDTYDWTLANCTFSVQANLGNALRLKNTSNNGSITLPALPEGATYKAIYLTENTNNTSKAANIVCKQGDQEAATGTFNYYGEVSQQGGVLKLEIPAEYAQGPLTIEHDCADAVWINRMTVTYEGDLHKVEPNDLYSVYKNGEDITIDGITYKAGEYAFSLIDATQQNVDIRGKVNNVAEKTILFLDTQNDYQCYTASTVNVASDIVLIGRYRDRKANFQPQMNWKLVSTDEANPAGLSWVNLNIDAGLDIATSNNNYLLNNSGSTEDSEKFVIANCNLNNLNKDRIYQASVVNSVIKQVVLTNNVFQFNVATSADKYFFDFKACARLAAIEKITIENNLIYNKTNETAWLRIVSYTNATAQTDTTQQLELACNNNTFVNMIGRQIYFKLSFANSFTARNNIFYANADYDVQGSTLMCFYGVSPSGADNKSATDVCKTITIEDNIYYGLLSKNWNNYNSNSTIVAAGKNSQTKLEATPFETFEAENGIFTPKAEYVQYGVQAE